LIDLNLRRLFSVR